MRKVQRIDITRVTIAYDLTNEDFCLLLDKDLERDEESKPKLFSLLLNQDNVVEVDYDGMFVRHAIFVDLVMSDNFEQDKEDIKKVIEDYIK